MVLCHVYRGRTVGEEFICNIGGISNAYLRLVPSCVPGQLKIPESVPTVDQKAAKPTPALFGQASEGPAMKSNGMILCLDICSVAL
jgi:hypothetical protein